MHVLHILEATAGGTRRHVLDLLPALSRHGIKCSLIYSPLRNPDFATDASYLQRHDITTHCVPMTRAWDAAIDMAALRAIRSIARKSTFDIIHAHSSKAGFLGRLALAPRCKSTFIYTPHCIAFQTALPRRQKQMARVAETMLAPMTDAYIAVSRSEKRGIVRAHLAAPSHVHLVSNGVDVNRFDVSQPANPVFTIGCFGRLSHQKNQAFVLKVLSQLRKQQKDINVLFVGDGEIKPQLHQLAHNLNLEDAVQWHGETADPEKIYMQCDAIIQPSRWEGCPYTVLEAMASARPIVASPAGAMPHLVAGCGEIHPLSRIDDWVQTLLSWKDNSELREARGNAARERAQKYFSLQTMVAQTMEVYRDSLAKEKGTFFAK